MYFDRAALLEDLLSGIYIIHELNKNVEKRLTLRLCPLSVVANAHIYP